MKHSNKNWFARLHEKLKHFFRENEFLLLLIVLLAFLLVPAFIINRPIKDITIYSLLIMVLIIGVYELADSKRSFLPGVLLAILTMGLLSINFSSNEDLVFVLRMGCLTSFFGLLTIHVMIRLIKAKTINTNIIYAAVNGYVLIGLIGGMCFRFINHFYPHSFMFANGLKPRIDDLTYFSFITLSTLGYGDITPTSAPGKSLAIFISIIGQMYTAIVIGIIIGKYILNKTGGPFDKSQ